MDRRYYSYYPLKTIPNMQNISIPKCLKKFLRFEAISSHKSRILFFNLRNYLLAQVCSSSKTYL